MTENPYQSPKTAGAPTTRQQNLDPQWRAFGERRERSQISLDRPIGITIACVLNLIIPFALLVLFMSLDSARVFDIS